MTELVPLWLARTVGDTGTPRRMEHGAGREETQSVRPSSEMLHSILETLAPLVMFPPAVRTPHVLLDGPSFRYSGEGSLSSLDQTLISLLELSL